ncbi:hypothetical protein KJ885_03305 [Patescibacteria group bacterium]|nr:hypothetical protein [Patescibacteria group bacterium]
MNNLDWANTRLEQERQRITNLRTALGNVWEKIWPPKIKDVSERDLESSCAPMVQNIDLAIGWLSNTEETIQAIKSSLEEIKQMFLNHSTTSNGR